MGNRASNHHPVRHAVGAILLVGCWALVPRLATGQVLETETARTLAHGAVKLGGNVEWQTSTEGWESAIPLVFEYGLTDRLEILAEPVVSAAIHPTLGSRTSGVGDTEVTATYLLRRETSGGPAVALAGEVKIPTAKSTSIGTGETDYTAYFIASRRFGRFDTHWNLAYTFVGQPPGVTLDNLYGGAFAVEYRLGPKVKLFSEFLASTGTGLGEGDASSGASTVPVPPEASGQEIVGTFGGGIYLTPQLFLSMSVSYDNNHAVLWRPGITFRSK